MLGAACPWGTKTNPRPSGPTWQEKLIHRQGNEVHTGAEGAEDPRLPPPTELVESFPWELALELALRDKWVVAIQGTEATS